MTSELERCSWCQSWKIWVDEWEAEVSVGRLLGWSAVHGGSRERPGFAALLASPKAAWMNGRPR